MLIVDRLKKTARPVVKKLSVALCVCVYAFRLCLVAAAAAAARLNEAAASVYVCACSFFFFSKSLFGSVLIPHSLVKRLCTQSPKIEVKEGSKH